MEQLSMTDAMRARDDAIARAERHAVDEWKTATFGVIRQLAESCQSFTTDDVWLALQKMPEVATHEPRALGSMMRQAANLGWIEPTDRYKNSARPECHARPVKVWRSRICNGFVAENVFDQFETEDTMWS
jgi:hypothetical protein